MLWSMDEETDGLDQSVKNDLITFDKIRRSKTSEGDDCTTGCLLHCLYFRNYCKTIAINLSKQQVLDADPKAIQQINFTANIDRDGNATIFFIVEEMKETILDFSQGTVNFQLNKWKSGIKSSY